MSILSTIKRAKDTYVQNVLKVVAPSKEEATERRKKTFGTESKVVAGVATVAAAAALYAAPGAATTLATSSTARAAVGSAAITALKGTGNVLGKVTTNLITNPLKTVGGALGALTLFGAVKENPKLVTTAGKTAIDTGASIGKFTKENPEASFGTALVLAGGGYLASKFFGKDKNDTKDWTAEKDALIKEREKLQEFYKDKEKLLEQNIPQDTPKDEKGKEDFKGADLPPDKDFKGKDEEDVVGNDSAIIPTSTTTPAGMETQTLKKGTKKKRKFKKKQTDFGLKVQVVNVNNSRISKNYLNTSTQRMIK